MSDAPLLDLIGECHALRHLDEFRPGILRALAAAVPSDYASLNAVGPAPEDVIALAVPPVAAEIHEVWARHAHENPILVHMQRTGDGQPCRFSDLIGVEGYHRLDLYRYVYRRLGVEHQIAFTLPAPRGHVLAIALSRRASDFSDAERDLLAQARPHLIQAYRNAAEFTRLLRRLGDRAGAPPAELEPYGLTPRESEVLRLVAAGRSNRDIAGELGVSPRTVQKHLEHAYPKLGVATRSQAARVAWSAVWPA